MTTKKAKLDEMQAHVDRLTALVNTQGQLLGLIDQWVLVNKLFFDQVKLNAAKKPEAK